jgi:excisionase family DNA binding protein
MSDRLLIPEVAKRLRSSKERVLRLIRAGQLRAINTGTGDLRPRWVVRVEDLDEFENKRANAPATLKLERAPRRRQAGVPNYYG